MGKHAEGCLLCGSELVYLDATAARACALCSATTEANATCSAGHFVCDACHRSSSVELIERACATTRSVDPVQLATALMRSPTIAMHGPEHHFLVPAVLLATYDNALGRTDHKAAHLAEARRRAERVPGGFCGTHGSCGAGIGTGIFWSVATGATPLTTETWSQANQLTARSLLRIAEHGGPRCCKRDTWHALLLVMEEIGRRVPETGWQSASPQPVCEHTARNKQCLAEQCVFCPPEATRPSLTG